MSIELGSLELPSIPNIRTFREIGPNDPVLDIALVTGIALFFLIILVGRNSVTQWLTVIYLLFVPTYLIYRYAQRSF